eukprot:scaffold184669_cov26-Tisochrysis_lutea.AAC.9
MRRTAASRATPRAPTCRGGNGAPAGTRRTAPRVSPRRRRAKRETEHARRTGGDASQQGRLRLPIPQRYNMRGLEATRGKQRARAVEGESADTLEVHAAQHSERVASARVPNERSGHAHASASGGAAGDRLAGRRQQPVGVDRRAEHVGRVG